MNEAFNRGFAAGQEWEGPDGDGSMGNGSVDFVAEQATQDTGSDAEFAWWMAGFEAGRRAPRSEEG